jgi:hypothetical protein
MNFSHVDDNPGMRAGPDLLGTLSCSDGELDLPLRQASHLRKVRRFAMLTLRPEVTLRPAGTHKRHTQNGRSLVF